MGTPFPGLNRSRELQHRSSNGFHPYTASVPTPNPDPTEAQKSHPYFRPNVSSSKQRDSTSPALSDGEISNGSRVSLVRGAPQSGILSRNISLSPPISTPLRDHVMGPKDAASKLLRDDSVPNMTNLKTPWPHNDETSSLSTCNSVGTRSTSTSKGLTACWSCTRPFTDYSKPYNCSQCKRKLHYYCFPQNPKKDDPPSQFVCRHCEKQRQEEAHGDGPRELQDNTVAFAENAAMESQMAARMLSIGNLIESFRPSKNASNGLLRNEMGHAANAIIPITERLPNIDQDTVTGQFARQKGLRAESLIPEPVDETHIRADISLSTKQHASEPERSSDFMLLDDIRKTEQPVDRTLDAKLGVGLRRSPPTGPRADREREGPHRKHETTPKQSLETSTSPIHRRQSDTYRPEYHSTRGLTRAGDYYRSDVRTPSPKPRHLYSNERKSTCKKVTCHFWATSWCKRKEADCYYAHRDTGISFPNGKDRNKWWTCHYWWTNKGCHYKEFECLYAHSDTGLYVGSDNLASKKHITCFFIANGKTCGKPEENCSYSHRDTGLVALPPPGHTRYQNASSISQQHVLRRQDSEGFDWERTGLSKPIATNLKSQYLSDGLEHQESVASSQRLNSQYRDVPEVITQQRNFLPPSSFSETLKTNDDAVRLLRMSPPLSARSNARSNAYSSQTCHEIFTPKQLALIEPFKRVSPPVHPGRQYLLSSSLSDVSRTEKTPSNVVSSPETLSARIINGFQNQQVDGVPYEPETLQRVRDFARRSGPPPRKSSDPRRRKGSVKSSRTRYSLPTGSGEPGPMESQYSATSTITLHNPENNLKRTCKGKGCGKTIFAASEFCRQCQVNLTSQSLIQLSDISMLEAPASEPQTPSGEENMTGSINNMDADLEMTTVDANLGAIAHAAPISSGNVPPVLLKAQAQKRKSPDNDLFIPAKKQKNLPPGLRRVSQADIRAQSHDQRMSQASISRSTSNVEAPSNSDNVATMPVQSSLGVSTPLRHRQPNGNPALQDWIELERKRKEAENEVVRVREDAKKKDEENARLKEDSRKKEEENAILKAMIAKFQQSQETQGISRPGSLTKDPKELPDPTKENKKSPSSISNDNSTPNPAKLQGQQKRTIRSPSTATQSSGARDTPRMNRSSPNEGKFMGQKIPQRTPQDNSDSESPPLINRPNASRSNSIRQDHSDTDSDNIPPAIRRRFLPGEIDEAPNVRSAIQEARKLSNSSSDPTGPTRPIASLRKPSGSAKLAQMSNLIGATTVSSKNSQKSSSQAVTTVENASGPLNPSGPGNFVRSPPNYGPELTACSLCGEKQIECNHTRNSKINGHDLEHNGSYQPESEIRELSASFLPFVSTSVSPETRELSQTEYKPRRRACVSCHQNKRKCVHHHQSGLVDLRWVNEKTKHSSKANISQESSLNEHSKTMKDVDVTEAPPRFESTERPTPMTTSSRPIETAARFPADVFKPKPSADKSVGTTGTQALLSAVMDPEIIISASTPLNRTEQIPRTKGSKAVEGKLPTKSSGKTKPSKQKYRLDKVAADLSGHHHNDADMVDLEAAPSAAFDEEVKTVPETLVEKEQLDALMSAEDSDIITGKEYDTLIEKLKAQGIQFESGSELGLIMEEDPDDRTVEDTLVNFLEFDPRLFRERDGPPADFDDEAKRREIAARPSRKERLAPRKFDLKHHRLGPSQNQPDWKNRKQKYGSLHRECDRGSSKKKGWTMREPRDSNIDGMASLFSLDQEPKLERVEVTMEEFFGLPEKRAYCLIGAEKLIQFRTLAFRDATTATRRVADKEKWPVGGSG